MILSIVIVKERQEMITCFHSFNLLASHLSCVSGSFDASMAGDAPQNLPRTGIRNLRQVQFAAPSPSRDWGVADIRPARALVDVKVDSDHVGWTLHGWRDMKTRQRKQWNAVVLESGVE